MRTRFPPSPTGMLHIGGLRTALYCYLVAKQSGSNFVLRIEDTDREREVAGAVENILEALNWIGCSPDEGVVLQNETVTQLGDKGPYIQSERTDIYKEHVQKLLDNDQVYYAFDTPEEIEQMREDERARGNPAPKYDAGTRMKMNNSLTLSAEELQAKLDANEPYVLRLKVDPEKVVVCNDLIRGKIEAKGYTLDDQILMKSDGFPTYHLANIVDDHLMEIELVLRGEEWLPSLPKHVLLYEAFDWELPQFAHVPLLLNKGGGKLSKRQGDVGATDFKEKGYLPEAMVNFLALLGWNPGTTEEIFSLEELVEEFSIEKINKSGAVFDSEKLDWLQGQWMRKMDNTVFAERIKPIVCAQYPSAEDDVSFLEKAALIQERITFFHEAPEMLSYYYSEPKFDMEIVANKKQKVDPEMVPEIVNILIDTLQDIDEASWNHDTLKDVLFAKVQEKEMKNGQLLWPLRAILTGLPYSPGAFEVAEVLGKTTSLQRLQNAKEEL